MMDKQEIQRTIDTYIQNQELAGGALLVRRDNEILYQNTFGFADTAAFRWLCENAEQYGFILRYPKEAESVTGITYEPWHWRYVGAENAALLNQSGLCLEDAIAVLQRIAAGETVTG